MEMTGGQALVQSLKIEGISTIFGLPGIQLDFAMDALWEERESIDFIHTRHEQATAYMADGFARTTGEIGTCLVVPGPGVLNAAAGISTAYACSSPVLLVAGQVQSDMIDANRGVLHEINDQLGTISSVCKHVERAMTPEEVPLMVHRAARELRTGRPRPVEIEVPPDVLERVGDVTLPEPEDFSRDEADTDELERAAELLGRAERPLIVSGGGVLSSGAWDELRELAEMLEAPVMMTDNGRGGLSDRNYRAQPQQAVRELIPAADAVLAIGTRYYLGPQAAQMEVPDGQAFIHIDVDADEVGRNRTPDLGIVGDAKHALRELVERVPRHNRSRDSREAELAAMTQQRNERLEQMSVQHGYAHAIRDELPDDGILINESTQVGYWSRTGFPIYEPRTYVNSGYQGTLGYGFATALGAQVGNPHRRVVSINGDGGFMYNVQELSTMAKFNIPLVTVVFDDGAYGNVRRIQQIRMGERPIGSDLRNPDWVQMAESFGVAATRATNPDELRAAVRGGVAGSSPLLIEVPMPAARDLPSVFPMQALPPRPVLEL
ncbi:MAG: thiamine pyrophosphate-binding protein [Dehalococcoidia bacterium]|jgi:acetolactate synthase-1/2/3 large subunit|nr:thiamine pyrophosphate-binding protein [Dehalococcoidia bacterium]